MSTISGTHWMIWWCCEFKWCSCQICFRYCPCAFTIQSAILCICERKEGFYSSTSLSAICSRKNSIVSFDEKTIVILYNSYGFIFCCTLELTPIMVSASLSIGWFQIWNKNKDDLAASWPLISDWVIKRTPNWDHFCQFWAK